MQLIGSRQFLHEVDGKIDQEEAARAWGRFYSENVTEGDLDAILAYYRSPAGQKDVSASRAALEEVQRYMAQKRPPAAAPASAMSAAAANGGQSAAGAGVNPAARQSGTGVGAGGVSPTAGATAAGSVGSAAASSAGGSATPSATVAGSVGPAPNVPSSAAARTWDRQPTAPDGRIVPSPTLPEQCDIPPTPAPSSHAGPSAGKSVVCVCTDEQGTLTREPVIAESSGDPRVDTGALKMARVDSGRYSPPTLQGHPQSACFRFAIDFSRHQ